MSPDNLTTNEPQDIPAASHSEMTPDEAAASLAFATNLSDQLLPQNPMAVAPEGAEGGDMATQGQETPQFDMQALVEALRGEIQTAIKEEVGSLRKDLEDALKDEEGED